MGDSSETVTTVRIFNQTYNVRSEGAPDYIQNLAELLDGKMCEIAKLTPTVDTARVAVLAALNLADNYLATRERLELLEQEVGERSARMISVLERCGDRSSP